MLYVEYISMTHLLFFHTVYGSPNPLHCSCDSHDTVCEVCQWNTEENWRRGGERAISSILSTFTEAYAAHLDLWGYVDASTYKACLALPFYLCMVPSSVFCFASTYFTASLKSCDSVSPLEFLTSSEDCFYHQVWWAHHEWRHLLLRAKEAKEMCECGACLNVR